MNVTSIIKVKLAGSKKNAPCSDPTWFFASPNFKLNFVSLPLPQCVVVLSGSGAGLFHCTSMWCMQYKKGHYAEISCMGWLRVLHQKCEYDGYDPVG